MMEDNPGQQPRVRQGMDYREHSDVQEVHAAIQREKREPRVGLEPLSMWLIAVYGLAIFLGGAYLGRYSGEFNGEALDPPIHPLHKGATAGGGGAAQQELTPFERGKKVFSANCAVCHQGTGLGSESQGYPPLAGSEFTNGGSERNAMIVMKGLQGPVTVKGKQFGSAVMQSWETLGDQKVADVLTYVRSEWGNKGSPVTKEQITALRKTLANHPGSFTAPDILAVPAEEDIPGGAPAAGAAPNDAGKPPAGQPPAPPKA